jgi:hypothetical protein
VEHTQLGLAAEVAARSASWFTSDACLITLGVLSFLELAATKNQELRELMGQLDPLVKPAMAGLSSLGFASATDLEIVDAAMVPAGMTTAGAFALLAMGGTFAATWVRMELLEFVEEIDSDDSLGLAKAISWMEEFWVLALVVLTVVLPFVFLAVVAVTMAAMTWTSRELERRAERNKVPCDYCQELVLPSAPHCPSCRSQRTQACDVGLFGQPVLERAIPDTASQPYRLLSKRRCGFCATRLPERTPQQVCTACRFPAFERQADVEQYAAWVSAKERSVFLACLPMSLVPLVGAIAVVVYYRVMLVSPYRRYIPARHAFVARWTARLVTLVVFMGSCVPGVMAVVVLINHRVYRRSFLAYAAKTRATGAAGATGHDETVLIRWDKGLLARLQRRKGVFAGALLVACVVLPVLAATVWRPSGADAAELPHCPTPAEQLVGTWHREWLAETYEADGSYTLRVLSPELLRGAIPETELMTLQGTYAVVGDTLTTQIRGSKRRYTFGLGEGSRSLVLSPAPGPVEGASRYERDGSPPTAIVYCVAGSPSAAGVTPAAQDVPPEAPRVVPAVPAAAPVAPTPAPAVAAAPPAVVGVAVAPTPAPTPAAPLTWLPLQRTWSRMHLTTSPCDDGAYDTLLERVVDSTTWTPSSGTSVALRVVARGPTEGATLDLVAQVNGGEPTVLLSYGPNTFSSCDDRQATVVYVGTRQDGTLLVSMERLPQERGDGARGRRGHTKRAVLRWNAGTRSAQAVGTWEGIIHDVPPEFRVRDR